MARKNVLNFVENDEQDQIKVEWIGMDISVFPTIRLNVSLENGKSLVLAAVIDDAPNGKFHFEFGAGDLIRGQHAAEIEFIDAGGKSKTIPKEKPLILNVRSELG